MSKNRGSFHTILFAEEEWKILYAKIHRAKEYPPAQTTAREAVLWVAQLEGFLARKNDRQRDPITLWRGWKRLFDFIEGWNLALASCVT